MAQRINSVPDGGYGWVVCFVTALLWMLSCCTFGVYGVIFLDLVEHFQTDKTTIAWIGGIQFLLNAVLIHVLHTNLVKRFGCRLGGILGPLLASTGYVLSAFTPNVYVLFLTFGAMPGVGCSITGYIGFYVVSQWFEKKRPLAVALLSAGFSFGYFAWPPVTVFLIDMFAWRGALLIVAGIQLHGLLLVAFLRQPPSKIICIEVDCAKRSSLDKEMIPQAKTIKVKVKGRGRKYFKMALFFCCIVCTSIGNVIPISYLPTRGKIAGHSASHSAWLVSLLGIVNVVITPIVGIVGTAMRGRRVWLCGVALLLAGISSMVSTISESYMCLVIYAVSFGMCSGVYFVLSHSLPGDIWDRKDMLRVTAAFESAFHLGNFAGNLLPGIVLDLLPGSSGPYILGGAIHFTAALLLFTLLFMRAKDI